MDSYFGYQDLAFASLAAKSGVTIPMLLKILGIAPPGGELEGDHLWLRDYGERLPLRGGGWDDQSRAGVFALNFRDPRTDSHHAVGFRAAFVNLVFVFWFPPR